MTTREKILKELGHYIGEQRRIELSMYADLPGNVTICLHVAEIIKEYKSTQEDEDRVCELLSDFLKIHFRS